MEKETPDELFPGKGKEFLLILVSVIRVAEQYFLSTEILYAGIADGSTIGISGKVFYCITVSVECLLEERDPVNRIKMVNEFLPLIGIFKWRGTAIKRKPARIMKVLKPGQKLSPEYHAKDRLWNDESFVTGLDKLTCRSQSASGEADMKVGMEGKLLSPGVENRNDPRCGSHIFFVTTKCDERTGSR